ncbi:unnamed protein product [Prorocentrum cordatum]|uniref:PUM-HD domain-containing protein n=1 Tax=Prorocentrum cordatum TaxID=2364126 RepID=A0ABN9Q9I7_9DINO|nr:unnamed protein product [Polarella glacialis]
MSSSEELAGASTPKRAFGEMQQDERTVDAATSLSDVDTPKVEAVTPTDSTCVTPASTCCTPRSSASTPHGDASWDQTSYWQQSTAQACFWQPESFLPLCFVPVQGAHLQPQAVPSFCCAFASGGQGQHFASPAACAAQPRDEQLGAQLMWWPQEQWPQEWWSQARSSGECGLPAAVAGASGEWRAPAAVDEWYEALQTRALDKDNEMKRHVLAAICGHALQFSHDKKGCRLLQWALDHADRETLHALLTELHGHMSEMYRCPNANYVAQKIFNVLPAERMGAVLQEFEGRMVDFARHRYGCRIVIQLLAHCGRRPECAALIDELLNRPKGLIDHAYAHHTFEAVLEHGREDFKQRIVCALAENLLHFARHHHGSFVVLAALVHCSDDVASWLCGLLNEGIVGVTAKKPGCNLYHELCLHTHPRTSEPARAALGLHAMQLRQRSESLRLVDMVQQALEADASPRPSGLPLTLLPPRAAWADVEDDLDEDLASARRPELPEPGAQRWQ